MTAATDDAPVRVSVEDGIAVLVLAMPTRRNALSAALVGACLDALGQPPVRAARALVLAGDGPAFCAGADIGDLLGAGWLTANPVGPTPMDLFEAIHRDPRPVIAAATGLVLGGGFELTLCCDLVVAAADAVFAFPEIAHGVMPNTGLLLLGSLIGPRRALELVLTRRRLAAAEAFAVGLASSVEPPEATRPAAIALARRIVTGAPPTAIAAAKRSMRHGSSDIDWAFVRASLAHLSPAEWQEGLHAFTQRRQPDYDPFWRNHAAGNV